jgi:hypothetical protein
MRAAANVCGIGIKTARRVCSSTLDFGNLPPCNPPKIRVSAKEKCRRIASRFSPFIKALIRRKIHEMYKAQKQVTANDLLRNLQYAAPDEEAFRISTSTLKLLLHGMGFSYQKIKNRTTIYERMDLTVKRIRYLRRKRELMQRNAYFVFMDETWVHTGMSHVKDWIDHNAIKNPRDARNAGLTSGPTPPNSRGKRGIVIGAITEDGPLLDVFEVIISGTTTDDGDYHRVSLLPNFLNISIL